MPVPDFDGAVQINVGDFREMIHQVAFVAPPMRPGLF